MTLPVLRGLGLAGDGGALSEQMLREGGGRGGTLGEMGVTSRHGQASHRQQILDRDAPAVETAAGSTLDGAPVSVSVVGIAGIAVCHGATV